MDRLGGYYAKRNKSERKTNVSTNMWNIKNYNQLVNITKRRRLRENKLELTRGEGEAGRTMKGWRSKRYKEY